MIEAVSTVSVQNVAQRVAPRSVSSYVPPVTTAPQINFVGSRIRMDNLLDLAILEFRSNETGDVMMQYPTEPQIRAFQRAASSEAETPQQARADAAQNAPATPQPAQTATSTQTAAPVSVDAAVSATGGDATGTQSIVV